MAGPDNEDGVVLYEPDRGLKEKLGDDVTMDDILSPKVVEEAEKVIERAHDDLLAGIRNELKVLEQALDNLREEPEATTPFKHLVGAAFAIKSTAGMCGYPMASALAKSLHVFCEFGRRAGPVSDRDVKIISCHLDAIRAVFVQKIPGYGGKTGRSVMTELERLTHGVM